MHPFLCNKNIDMNFKKLRYNLIVIGLVALVCCYMGMSIFFAPASSNVGNSGSAQEEPIEDIEIPEEPDDGDDDGDDEDEETNIPTDAIELINYAIDIMNDGLGYECNYNSAITNTPTSMSNMNPVQNLSSVITRGVNSKGEKVGTQKDFYYSSYSGVGDSMLARYFRGFYDNQTTGQVNVIETTDYNVSNKTYNAANAYRNDVMSIDDVINEFKIIYTQKYPIKFTKKNCTIIKDDSKKSKTYRTITVSVKLDSLSQEYLDFFTSTKQMKGIDYKKVEVTFVIKKSNGYISKIKRNELLMATAINIPVLGSMQVQSDISIEQTFTKMNETIILPDSL